MSLIMTYEEAGLTLVWVGKEMAEDDVVAGAALDFETVPGAQPRLVEHLIKSGISSARAVEIADNVKLENLIGYDLEQG